MLTKLGKVLEFDRREMRENVERHSILAQFTREVSKGFGTNCRLWKDVVVPVDPGHRLMTSKWSLVWVF
jgi:hypothetical protein